ncbi:P-loop containing nucleoside triphosphate hydrolase protein [Hypoxylon sp. FL0543]|nr:P-loop containing nucleoside triphosphate hydrolase protein [Hypoxylon sp. FL0543]
MDGIGIKQLCEEQKELLDLVADLRSHGLHYPLGPPQIVVVGGQFSGKTSLLEAISGFRFSAKDGLPTRFPTELVLSTKSRHEIDVEIQSSTSSEEVATFTKHGLGGRDTVLEATRDFGSMRLKDGADFSEVPLRIEISGPEVPCLTLVDVPGFRHSKDKTEPDAYRDAVDRLVNRYMKCDNSITLAVIPADKDFTKEDVTSMVQPYEQFNDRVIGVLTKVDLLEPESTEEHNYVQLAKNGFTSEQLPLGWHVIQNRGAEDTSDAEEQRAEEERSFLESGAWSALPPSDLGVENLRKKISGLLYEHIRNNLSGLVQSIRDKIQDHEVKLKRLGQPRSTPMRIRMYLEQVTSRFHTLCLDAIGGNYDDEFFGSLFIKEEDPAKAYRLTKIRAVVRELNQSFARVLETKGSKRIILPRASNAFPHGTTDSRPKRTLPISLWRLDRQYEIDDPEKVSFEDMAKELACLLETHQGNEFPGTSNDRLAMKLFRDQSQPWEKIARRHIQLMLTVANGFVRTLLTSIIQPDGNTLSAILSGVVEPFFDEKSVILESNLEEILRHYKSGYPQFHDTEFSNILAQKRRGTFDPDALRGLMESRPDLLTPAARQAIAQMNTPEHSTAFAVQELIHKAEAYYEMSLRTFTDQVIILAVENCLIRELPSVMTSAAFDEMTDDEITGFASESAELQEEREKLQAGCDAFAKGLEVCHRHNLRIFTPGPLVPPESEEASSPGVENEPTTGKAKVSTSGAEDVSTNGVQNTPTLTVGEASTLVQAEDRTSGTSAHPPTLAAQSNVQKAPDGLAEPDKGNHLSIFNPPTTPKAPSVLASAGQSPSKSANSLLFTAKLPLALQQEGGTSSAAATWSLFGSQSPPAATFPSPPGNSIFSSQQTENAPGLQAPAGHSLPQNLFGIMKAPQTDAPSQGPPKPVAQPTAPSTTYWSRIDSGVPCFVALPLQLPMGREVEALNHICFQPPYDKYSPEELRCMAFAKWPTMEIGPQAEAKK